MTDRMKTQTAPESIPSIQSFVSVDWSYPTSPNADRFGFRKGCWTGERIGFATDQHRRVAISGHSTRAEAYGAAIELGLEICGYTPTLRKWSFTGGAAPYVQF